MIDQNATHNFHGIWIPKEVWFDKNLTWMEKLFFIEIYYLDNGEGCFASNTYFSNFFDLTPGRCSQLINSLQAKNYIKIQYQKDGKQIKKRIINIEENGIKYIKGVFNILKGGIKYIKGGYLENDEENNILYNNIKNIYVENNFSKKQKTKKQISLNRKYRNLAQTLAEIIQTKKNINKTSQLSNWVKHIQLLVEKDLNNARPIESIKRVKKALEWYSQNIGEPYVPVIESGNSLRTKYDKLEAAIERDQTKHNSTKRYKTAYDNNNLYKNLRVTVIE